MNETRSRVRSGRLKLLLVPAVFVASFVAAWIAFQLGWWPGTKSHGQPVLPQRSFQSIPIVMDNGEHWAWRDPTRPRMTLVALSRGPCGQTCIDTLTLLRNARITLGQHQDRLRLLHIGQPPAGQPGSVLAKSWHHGRDVTGKLASFMPPARGEVSAILVESNGTALVQYPAGFSPDGVKDDLHKVIR